MRPGLPVITSRPYPVWLTQCRLQLSHQSDFVLASITLKHLYEPVPLSSFLPNSLVYIHHYTIKSSMMADYLEPHCCMKDRQLCTITPNYWLQHVASNQAAPAHSRACAARSLLHNARLHGARQSHCLQHAEAHQEASHGIVPSYMHREILDSPDASDEQKDRAKKSIEKSSSIRAAREVFQPPMTTIQPKRPFRVLYDSEHTDELPGNRIRTEMQTTTMDIQASNVWDSFGNTFEFSYEVFGRNSIDDLGMSMVGSVHFDDELVGLLFLAPSFFADRHAASSRLRQRILGRQTDGLRRRRRRDIRRLHSVP